MISKEEIAERFQKWDDKNWSNIEKEISSFQKKVADIMVLLGSVTYDPKNIKPCNEDECIIGEDIYNELVRPGLVKIGYLPKEKKDKKPTKKESSDDDSEEEKEKEKEKVEVVAEEKKEEEKGKGKKGGKKEKAPKAPKIKKEDLMKQAIVKTNFAKEIDFVLKSFNPDKMTVDFGFSQKKLELKLSTFFYVAWFIRKHKANLGLDESLVYELINILIKVYRIFNGFKGKSFINSSIQETISVHFLQDLKDCLEGLKDYYKYTAQNMMVKYPRLVYYTNYDQYFPTLDIKPYPSQIEFVDAVRSAVVNQRPTLIFYKTMIGSGKTSTAISLSSMIRELKYEDKKFKHLQLIYCCTIKSVRSQVGKLAYNEKQSFGLGTMDTLKNPKNIENNNQENRAVNLALVDKLPQEKLYFPRIINSFATNDKIVDLVITDLFTTRALFTPVDLPAELKVKQLGQLERENVIMFLDEPTAFCEDESSITKKIFEILGECPPKVIVFASATMPEKEELTKTVELIRQRNPNLNVLEVSSKEFQIGCQFCTFQGDIIFPHSGIKTKQQLESIIELISKNPFLMRLYTGPSLFHLVDKCKKAGVKKIPQLHKLPEIRQPDILRETLATLNNLKEESDKVIEQVCTIDSELMNINHEQDKEDDKKKPAKKKDDDDDEDFFGKEQEQVEVEEKKVEAYVNLKKLLRGDAYKFLGGCLIATANPMEFAKKHFQKWIEDNEKNPSVKKLMHMYERDQKLLEDKLAKIDEDKNMRSDEKQKKKSELMNEEEPKFRFPDTKRINTFDHYAKYCKNKSASHTSMLIRPIIIEKVGFDLFSEVEDWLIKLLFCGVAVYSKEERSTYYLNKVEELASANFLAYIICDESLCYGTNFPISNVILEDSLANKLSMNEMFQLIGRAGRVGQSWTARAFLQPKGVEMLKRYISEGQKALNSEEARVFEAFANTYLDDPTLEFKSKRFYIQYVSEEQSQGHSQPQNQRQKERLRQIEIVLRSHDNINECTRITEVAAVPYRMVDGKLQLLMNVLPKTVETDPNIHLCINTPLLAQDIPTVTVNNQQTFDANLFYTNEEQFIRQTLENAVKRVFKTEFEGASEITVKNPFTRAKYSNYLNVFDIQNAEKRTENNRGTYVFFLETTDQKLKSSSGPEYSWIPFRELDKRKVNNDFDDALQKLHPVEYELLKYPSKIVLTSSEFYSLNAAYQKVKKNYPIYIRQFQYNLARSANFKANAGTESYEAVLATKYMSTFDERDQAVDHHLSEIWNKIPNLVN